MLFSNDRLNYTEFMNKAGLKTKELIKKSSFFPTYKKNTNFKPSNHPKPNGCHEIIR